MPPGSAREVLLVSLRLGLTSFGGPIAHLGYQREAFVVRRRWLDDAAFADLVALAQSLPGPASSQLSVAVGHLRAGWRGALAAWLGFTLPSAIVMTMLGLWAAGAGIPADGPVAGVIAGLKAAAVAVVAQAVVAMGRQLAPDAPRLVMATLALLAMLAVPTPFAQAAVILAGGLAGWVAWRTDDGTPTTTTAPVPAGGRRTSIALLAAFLAVVVGPQLLAAATRDPGAGFVAALSRSGALVFGGGHVVLPLLDAGVVAPGWVGEGSFVAGYGAAQAMPGPLFTFAGYLGAVSTAGPGGIAGAAIATVAIFLPGMLLVLAALPVLGALRRQRGLGAALRGVNAVVVGILAAALISPVGTTGIRSPATAVIAASGFAGLVSGRVPPLAVVGGSALAMGCLAVVGIS